jgi:hypothetical protein
MKYQTPEVTVLTPAINAIQATPNKPLFYSSDDGITNEGTGVYQDWES